MSLNDLARKHKTDKREQDHNYVAVYEPLFEGYRQDTFNFLEIGVCRGASHKMWREWFPNATIYGVDNAPKTIKRFQGEERMDIEYLHQGHDDQLIEYAKKGPWRVIIDDGSHITSHQIRTFEILWGQVEPGGYYVVEDTHTSYESFTIGWSPRTHDDCNIWIDTDMTLMQWMYGLVDAVCEPASREYPEVESVSFHPGLAVIKKRDA